MSSETTLVPESLITLTSTSNRSDVKVRGRAYQLVLEKCALLVTTLVSSSADVVVQILSGSTELATATLTTTQAKDDLVYFTPATGIANIVRIPADTVLGVKVKTAASSAGVVRANLVTQVADA